MNNRGETVEWVIDLYFKPLDILSGDSYSIREIEEGRVLIYLADAMGKGLAASMQIHSLYIFCEPAGQ